MMCQHCQTWILDGEHRCGRCGRRVRATPSRVSPTTYPIAASASASGSATATARAYQYDPETVSVLPGQALPQESGQQRLFSAPANQPRVIAFDSLASATERKAIRERAAEHERSESVKSTRVDSRRTRTKRNDSTDQHRLEFFSSENIVAKPSSNVVCDAPVAPVSLRIQAAVIDLLFMLAGCAIGVALFAYAGGSTGTAKHASPFIAAGLMTIPILYKSLWSLAGLDSFGMQVSGLELVDFDGRRPSPQQRYQRLAGSFLSLLAAGVGLAWALLDEDRLTWHDHISCTFPTLAQRD